MPCSRAAADEQVHDLLAGERVERAGRLVGEQDLRARRPGPRASATRCACPPDSSPGAAVLQAVQAEPRRTTPAPARAAAPVGVPPSSSGRATFSIAVSSGTSWPNWKTNPNAVRRRPLRSASASVSTRSPSKRTSPASGTRMPARQCSRVDLPEPLGPMTARISPAATDTSAPRRAGVWPKLARGRSAAGIGSAHRRD